MSIKQLVAIHSLVKGVAGEGFFIAGGAVVDALYGKEPKDYDLVLTGHGMCEVETFHYLKSLSVKFGHLGFNTKVYQSYGLSLGGVVDPRSFQANFLGCMKVSMNNCQLDILVSRHPDMRTHVLHHDCNMNLVWFDGKAIRWEHGGDEPKISELVFMDNIPEDRKERMRKKWATFQAM